MDLSKNDFKVLEAIDSQRIETQRQLAESAGVSLGQVNYILKSLLAKGLVKIDRFKKHPNKFRYVYLLTPKGIETKSKLAVNYVINRLKKYNSLKRKIGNKLLLLESQGCHRVYFVGPGMVRDLVSSILRETNIAIDLSGYGESWMDLKNCDASKFDLAIIFDGEVGGFKEISKFTGIEEQRFTSLL